MNLFYQPDIDAGSLWLSPDESRHAIRVLRMATGDKLHLTDGKGVFYEGRITSPDSVHCEFQVLSRQEQPPKSVQIHIAIAPTKNADRIEWFVEKAAEIGVDRISFMLCDNSERKVLKLDRLEKLAISAMKQSGQAWLPQLAPMIPFGELVNHATVDRFIATVDPNNHQHLKTLATPGKNTLVLIGPEGDFSAEELKLALENGFRKASLGENRLRTETAGLVACHVLKLINYPSPLPLSLGRGEQ